MHRRRVVITGMGSVTGFGCGVERTWQGVIAGHSAVAAYYPFDDRTQPAEAAGAVNLAELPEETAGLGRAARFGLAAGREAWFDAGFSFPCRSPEGVGVCIGASTFPVIEDRVDRLSVLLKDGEWDMQEYAQLCRERPWLLTQSDAAGVSSLLSEMLGARGRSMTVQAACTSAAQAIGHAFETLRAGEGEVVLAGGTDSMLSMMCITGFKLLGSLAQRWEHPAQASRPFDRTRDGFVLAEGAAILVLEELEHARSRGARIYAEVIGYGSSCDAFRFTDMEPSGRGPVQCMRNALADAGITPESVGYVNAHGTATPLNDRIETMAIREVFGPHADAGLAVSSTKSQLGHLLCAAGAVEMMLTALAVYHGVLPPTINLERPDPECDLDYVRAKAQSSQVEIAVSNSFGFGGQNGSLVVRRWNESNSGSSVSISAQPERRRVCITAVGVQSPLGLDWPGHRRAWTKGIGAMSATGRDFVKLGVPCAGLIPAEESASSIRNRMLRKILTRSAGFAVAAAGEALRVSALPAQLVRTAELYVGSPGLDQDLNVFAEALLQSLEGEEGHATFSYSRFTRQGTSLIDPLFLVRSLPNAGLCGIAIEFDMQGRNLNITNGATSGMLALTSAAAAISRGDTDVALAGGYDSLVQMEVLLGHLGAGRIAMEGIDGGYLPAEGAVFFVLEEIEFARRRGANVLAEVTGWGTSHSSVEMASKGLERAAQASLKGCSTAPAMVFGDGLRLANHDAMEAEAVRRLGQHVRLNTAVERLGFAGGVTGLFSTLHALASLRGVVAPVIAWTSDRGRNHVAVALRSVAPEVTA